MSHWLTHYNILEKVCDISTNYQLLYLLQSHVVVEDNIKLHQNNTVELLKSDEIDIFISSCDFSAMSF